MTENNSTAFATSSGNHIPCDAKGGTMNARIHHAERKRHLALVKLDEDEAPARHRVDHIVTHLLIELSQDMLRKGSFGL